jgi:hypothetical protein
LYEGAPDASGGPTNVSGRLNPKAGQPAGIGTFKRELPTNVYRVDPNGHIDVVVTEDQVPDPNGLTFSPDYKRLYVISTGKGPATQAGGKGDVYAFDVGSDNKSRRKHFRFHDRWCEVYGRSALRYRRQSLGIEQRRTRPDTRRHCLESRWKASRTDRIPGSAATSLWRAERTASSWRRAISRAIRQDAGAALDNSVIARQRRWHTFDSTQFAYFLSNLRNSVGGNGWARVTGSHVYGCPANLRSPWP